MAATSVLVVYSSRYGATEGIAERMGRRLRSAGLRVDVEPAQSAPGPKGYDAVVLGSAVYHGSWTREALRYVRRHHAALSECPLWLFSRGPIGTDADAFGRDMAVTSEPGQIYGYRAWLKPRGNRVFFGALRHASLRRSDRLLVRLTAARAGWRQPEGDFRDWSAVDRWADELAGEISSVPANSGLNVGEPGPAQ